MSLFDGAWQRVRSSVAAIPVRKREDLLFVLILLLLSTLFFANVLFTDQVLVSDNLDRYLPWKYYADESQKKASNGIFDRVLEEYPQRLIAVQMVRSGEPPLWNPYCLSGMPLLATEPHRGFFYPFNGIFYLTDPLKALGYVSFVQLFLAGTFMYFYLKSIELPGPSALFGAIVFGLGGFFLPYLSWLDRVSTGIWMPLMFLCVEKLIRQSGSIWAMVLGFAIGMAGLSGHFGVLAYELLAVGLYSLWRLWSAFRNQDAAKVEQTALFLLVAVIIGGLLSAVQVMPTLEALPFVERAHLSYEDRVDGGPIPRALATAIIPDIFGNPVDDPSWGKHAFGPNLPGHYGNPSTYAGILPLVLAVWALAFKRNRYTAFFAVLAALSPFIFLDTEAFRVLYYVPIFRFGRQIEAKIIYFFAISALAALGMNSVLQMTAAARRRIARIIGLVLCVIGVSAIAAAVLLGMAINSSGMGKDLELARQWYHYNVSNVLRFLLLTFSCSLLLLLLSRGRIKRYLFSMLALILVVADLFYFGWRFNPVQNRADLYPQTDSISFLQADQSMYRVIRGPRSRDVFPPDSLQVYRIPDAQGYAPLLLDYYAEFMNLIEDNISSQRDIGSLGHSTSLSSKLLDLLNVKYVITRRELGEETVQPEQGDGNLHLVYDGEVRIYENGDVLPRAFVVEAYKVLDDKEEIFSELTSEGFDPASYVVLEQEPEVHSTSAGALMGESSASIMEYTPNKVAVEAEMSTNGFLVLSDLYYTGWKALVDGVEQRIYKADYIFRAVELEKGRHVVEFVFDPSSFKIGLCATALMSTAMCGWLVAILLRMKRLRSV